jgi:hypothetical protein
VISRKTSQEGSRTRIKATLLLLVFGVSYLVLFTSNSHAASAGKRKKANGKAVLVGPTGSRENTVSLDGGRDAFAVVPGGSSPGTGSLERSSDPCFGPALPTYRKVEERFKFAPVPPTVKPGASTIAPKLIKAEKLIEISCNGKPLRTFWKCMSFETFVCPKVPKPFDPSKYTQGAFKSGLITFEAPEPDFYPKPSNSAPLVGVGFFFGVSQDQYDEPQTRHLTACDADDCVTIVILAVPDGVFFDAGDGRPVKRDCDYAGPAVFNKVDAKNAGTSCRVDYSKAGQYRTFLQMLYKVRTTIVATTNDDLVIPPLPEPFFGTTSTPVTLDVRQRQPVVVG